MKPLREEIDSSDPTVAEAARLVSQIDPLVESALRARRVRRNLDHGTSRRRSARAVLALAVVFGLAGSAAAAWGIAQFVADGEEPKDGRSDLSAPSVSLPSSSGTSDGTSDAESRSDVALPAGTMQLGEDSDPERSLTRSEASHSPEGSLGGGDEKAVEPGTRTTKAGLSTAEQKRNSHKPDKHVQGAQTTLSEARIMQEAVEAMRSSNDPDKASKLLAEYQAKASSGHLDEEALALSIEVALAKKDPRAKEYAKRYLSAYPTGKFANLARSALGRP